MQRLERARVAVQAAGEARARREVVREVVARAPSVASLTIAESRNAGFQYWIERL